MYRRIGDDSAAFCACLSRTRPTSSKSRPCAGTFSRRPVWSFVKNTISIRPPGCKSRNQRDSFLFAHLRFRASRQLRNLQSYDKQRTEIHQKPGLFAGPLPAKKQQIQAHQRGWEDPEDADKRTQFLTGHHQTPRRHSRIHIAVWRTSRTCKAYGFVCRYSHGCLWLSWRSERSGS